MCFKVFDGPRRVSHSEVTLIQIRTGSEPRMREGHAFECFLCLPFFIARPSRVFWRVVSLFAVVRTCLVSPSKEEQWNIAGLEEPPSLLPLSARWRLLLRLGLASPQILPNSSRPQKARITKPLETATTWAWRITPRGRLTEPFVTLNKPWRFLSGV